VRDEARLPPWLRKAHSVPAETRRVRDALAAFRLNTVCDEALCPNRVDCLSRGTATFMLLGDRCTRSCGFCAVGHGEPRPPDQDEPARVARAARSLGLRYVVLTSVTRDDLADGGAAHFAEAVRAARAGVPGAGIEVLVPDFLGDERSLDTVLESGPDVFGHNVETVARLYPVARRGAGFERSLAVLSRAAQSGLVRHVKSALMLGLGESRAEIEATLDDLRGAGVTIVCLGQYLRPSPRHLPVARFVPPTEFEDLKASADARGFAWVAAGPFVRSSYEADAAALALTRGSRTTAAAVEKETA
jgi:lipoic acid synthetase